jgi:hypothetical protein
MEAVVLLGERTDIPMSHDGLSGLAVFGRIESRAGGLFGVTIATDQLAKAVEIGPGQLRLEELLAVAADRMREGCAPGERLIAVACAALGRASVEMFADALWKGDFDESEHPRHPAGSADSRGGQFRPKDPSALPARVKTTEDLAAEIRSKALRRSLRLRFLMALRIGTGAIASAAPVIGEIVDAMMIADFIRLAAEFHQLAIDARAADEFVRGGPYTLEQLRVSTEDLSFSSYGEFLKSPVEKRFGDAGPGFTYHHIVEQGTKDNSQNFPQERLQNTSMIIRLPRLLHEAVSAEYSRKMEDTGMTVRDWLRTQPFDVQREHGLKILRDLGILKSD